MHPERAKVPTRSPAGPVNRCVRKPEICSRCDVALAVIGEERAAGVDAESAHGEREQLRVGLRDAPPARRRRLLKASDDRRLLECDVEGLRGPVGQAECPQSGTLRRRRRCADAQGSSPGTESAKCSTYTSSIARCSGWVAPSAARASAHERPASMLRG